MLGLQACVITAAIYKTLKNEHFLVLRWSVGTDAMVQFPLRSPGGNIASLDGRSVASRVGGRFAPALPQAWIAKTLDAKCISKLDVQVFRSLKPLPWSPSGSVSVFRLGSDKQGAGRVDGRTPPRSAGLMGFQVYGGLACTVSVNRALAWYPGGGRHSPWRWSRRGLEPCGWRRTHARSCGRVRVLNCGAIAAARGSEQTPGGEE